MIQLPGVPVVEDQIYVLSHHETIAFSLNESYFCCHDFSK